jgi:hypothetical protein
MGPLALMDVTCRHGLVRVVRPIEAMHRRSDLPRVMRVLVGQGLRSVVDKTKLGRPSTISPAPWVCRPSLCRKEAMHATRVRDALDDSGVQVGPSDVRSTAWYALSENHETSESARAEARRAVRPDLLR